MGFQESTRNHILPKNYCSRCKNYPKRSRGMGSIQDFGFCIWSSNSSEECYFLWISWHPTFVHLVVEFAYELKKWHPKMEPILGSILDSISSALMRIRLRAEEMENHFRAPFWIPFLQLVGEFTYEMQECGIPGNPQESAFFRRITAPGAKT